GDWVVAIGNPFGLGGSVTAGIPSARARDINSGPYDDFLQTDASINRGNSGGPMFNMDGEVIGINTAIYSPSGGSIGIGFAIPSDLAKPVLDQLRDFGHARRGWLGVNIQNVSDEIAKSVKVMVWRKRNEVDLDVKVGELKEETQVASTSPKQEKPQAAISAVKALGLSLANLTPELRERFGLADDVNGVVITDIDNGGPSADKGMKAGDIVVEVAQDDVKTTDQILNKVDEAKKAGRKSVLLLVNRQGDLRFVAVKIDS